MRRSLRCHNRALRRAWMRMPRWETVEAAGRSIVAVRQLADRVLRTDYDFAEPQAQCEPRCRTRRLLRLRQIADGKHNIGEDGNPSSVRGDVRDWCENTDHGDNADHERSNKPAPQRRMKLHDRLPPRAVLRRGDGSHPIALTRQNCGATGRFDGGRQRRLL